MEERKEEHRSGIFSSYSNPWLIGLAVVLLVVLGLSLDYGYYGYREHAKVKQLTSNQAVLHSTLSQIQNHLDMLSTKLNQISAMQNAALRSANVPPANTFPRMTSSTVIRTAPANRSLSELQARVDDQQKQLRETQAEIAKTRLDLEGNLNLTRGELNGSIAKTHEELVALEKRGERDYFEFELTKSKQFERSGPLMLSLRKADTKHQRYDLAMIVDDNELGKKSVNLYEPIWIHAGEDAQPEQVVVNEISKDRVHGYVSVPKYRQLRSGTSTTPISTDSQSLNPTSGSQNPQQTPQPGH